MTVLLRRYFVNIPTQKHVQVHELFKCTGSAKINTALASHRGTVGGKR